MGQAKKLRFAGIAVTAIALVGIAPAAASAARYTGTFPGGGTVSFKTVTRDAKVVRVKEFAWKNVPVTCAQGDSTYASQLPYSMRVVSRLFSFQALDVGLIQSVSGKFTNHQRRASGTLNVFGALGLTRTNCKTGELTWSAVRR